MALPRFGQARGFYQAAKQRYDDARYLLHGDRTTAAVYLAGYAVECMLQALILSRTPQRQQPRVVKTFRGSRAHDFGWLVKAYRDRGGLRPSAGVPRLLSRVSSWTTDIRYRSGAVKESDAIFFLQATDEILRWADGRL